MNKKPVSYLQNDPRWKDKPYRVKGGEQHRGFRRCGALPAPLMVIQT